MNNVGRELVRYIGRIWLDGYAKLVDQLPAITNLIPFSGSLHIYARVKGGISALFYRDDAGVEHDLSLPPVPPPVMQLPEESVSETFDLMAFSSPSQHFVPEPEHVHPVLMPDEPAETFDLIAFGSNTPAFVPEPEHVHPVFLPGEEPNDTFSEMHITTYDEDRVFISPADSSTLINLHHYRMVTGSPGLVSGGVITNGIAGTINISAGVAIFRVTDDDSADLDCHDFGPFTNVAIPLDTNRFVYVDYNGGSPVALTSTDRADHNLTHVMLGAAVNEGGTITDKVDLGQVLPDGISLAEHYLRHVFGIVRAGGTGLILSSTGTRKVAVTAGELHFGRNLFEISAFDTNVSGSFDRYYRNGAGWTKVATQTTWADATPQYDNNSGVLQNMTNKFYSSSWFYQELDGHVVMLYGQAQHNNLADELAQSPPATVPPRLDAEGILIGRFVFDWTGGVITLDATQTVFTTTFSAAQVTSHASLSSLAWNISGHTGTADTIAAFDSSGAATFVPVPSQQTHPVFLMEETENEPLITSTGSGTTTQIITNSTTQNIFLTEEASENEPFITSTGATAAAPGGSGLTQPQVLARVSLRA